jgi:hypothetical protein
VSDRIYTPHGGGLPRPRPLLELMSRRAQGKNVVEETLQTLLRESVRGFSTVFASKVLWT